MTPQELKNSILQLAIQGKLVEQRAEEGTAAELLEKILAAKNAKSAKKNLTRSRGARGEKEASALSASPREEIPDDEKPFDIPENWEWVRLGDCVSNRAGLAYSRGNLDVKGAKMIRVLRGGNIADMGYCTKPDDVMISDEFVNAELFLRRNMLITPAVTSLDHVGKMARIEDDYDDMVVGGFVLLLTPYFNDDVFSRYLLCACSSKYFRDCCRMIVNKSGQAFYNLSRTKMMDQVIPLPPLAEQKRIVAKIEELLPLIDRYEKAWSKLEDFNKRFPVDMQKSVLQMAIQGKLVDHRPEEGTGEELYRQIQAEKQRLVKSGKIKKENPLPEITEDEIPFDIPESWKWVRIGDVFNLQAGKNIKSEEIHQEYSPEHKYRCYGGNGCRGYVADYNRTGHHVLIGRQGALCGNINYAEGDFYATEHAVVVEQFAGTDVYWCGYFLDAMNLNRYATATAQPGLAVAKVNQVLIPLPPLAEQKRIVAKLEEILPLCERLK